MKQFNLTLIQLCSGQYKMTNLSRAEDLIKQVCQSSKIKKSDLPHMVCLPEVFNFRSSSGEENSKAAEEIPGGHAFNWASQLAIKHKIWIVAGSILELSEDENKPYNTSFVVNPNGELVTKYRKINLFRLNLENVPELCEPKFRSAGSEICTFETAFGKIGLGICFDLRFPEIFREYRKQGCELIILPSAFTYKTGQAHWEILCKARAIENQVFFAAINQAIDSNCWGRSMIVGPWGETIATLLDQNYGVITETIDLDKVYEIREKLPISL
ncbi:MAG: carbon-nitrogen hydrolase family protein [Candidatus Caenarcaniphilales bacterium]|nr:carbon-nitrogen hydrolase family protein [Candidatus Caenarcaniphilales bacterium]